MRNRWALLSVLLFYFLSAFAEKLEHLIEFFSFSCTHCINSEPILKEVLAKTKAKYLPVIITQNGDQIGTALVYYACIKYGLGWQFRNTYFNAITNGLPAYTPQTLIYVLTQITANPAEIIKAAKSPEVQQKYALDQQLIQKYHVTSTPTWIINNQFALEGETSLLPYLGR